MLLLVDEALRGPRGAELAATLRARFRLAVIDEFQDTDPVQWQIFRTIFLDGGDPRPLYLVGDPKQSIYGFRGADVSTYDGARAAVTALGGVHHLERNFRSTPAVIDTYNAIFDQNAAQPVLLDRDRLRPPRHLRRQGERDRSTGSRPLTLLRVQADDEEKLPMRVVRARLARAIADEIAELLARGDVASAREIFVLTRTRKESAEGRRRARRRAASPPCWPCRRASTRPTKRGRCATCCARSPIRAIRRSACAPG